METKMQDYNEQTESLIEALCKSIPESAEAFLAFGEQAEKEGALSVKTKELISLSLGIAAHCVPCIAWHTKIAIDAGATRQELIEAGMVAVVMGGGPALAYLKYVIDACDQFGAGS